VRVNVRAVSVVLGHVGAQTLIVDEAGGSLPPSTGSCPHPLGAMSERRSILSIGRSGSVLSVGSDGSILSISDAGKVLGNSRWGFSTKGRGTA
jgi:hypothetical protein